MTEIDWLHLPPLPALRAFEATARLGGFSAAARALNVTHAAVSQQVRALEAALGVSLVNRNGRNLELTPEGSALGASLTDGFSTIQAAVDDLKTGSENRPVMITLTPAFATNWLMPRLGKLWSAHPDIAVSIRPDPNVLDLRTERIDFGIRFGMGQWPGVDARYLTSARYVVVGAPELFDGRTRLAPADMAALPWVLQEHWPEQRSWISNCVGLDPDKLKVTEFSTEELALSAARQGYGLHVSAAALVERDVGSGVLQLAFEVDEEGPGYYIVTPPGPLRAHARTIMRWLLKAV